MDKTSLASLEAKLEEMRRRGFDVGYDTHAAGVRITTHNQLRSLSMRGTVAEAYEYLEAMIEGSRQTCALIDYLSPIDAAVYVDQQRYTSGYQFPGSFQKL